MSESFQIVNDQVVQQAEDGTLTVIKGGISPVGFAVIHTYQRGWLIFAYLRDEQGIWWYNARKTKATLISSSSGMCKVFDDDYLTDGETLFLEDQAVPGADPGSFELLAHTPYFARDSQQLYVNNGSHFHVYTEIEVSEALAYGAYVTDLDHLFHLSEGLSDTNESKDEVREWLLENYPDVQGWWHPAYKHAEVDLNVTGNWGRTEAAWFYVTAASAGFRKPARQVHHLVRGAQADTFEPLSDWYARDTQRVYYRWRTVAGADPATFVPGHGRFARDAHHVYFNGYVVADADPDSFEICPGGEVHGYAKDARRVYRAAYVRTSMPYGHPDYILQPIPGADAASYQWLSPNGSWAQDDHAVYLWGKAAKLVDRASFVYLFDEGPQSWAHDGQALYNANGKRTVKGIDGGTFRLLNHYWGKDDQHVICMTTAAIQRSADAATFRITDNAGGAEDANYVYTLVSGSVKKSKRKR